MDFCQGVFRGNRIQLFFGHLEFSGTDLQEVTMDEYRCLHLMDRHLMCQVLSVKDYISSIKLNKVITFSTRVELVEHQSTH